MYMLEHLTSSLVISGRAIGSTPFQVSCVVDVTSLAVSVTIGLDIAHFCLRETGAPPNEEKGRILVEELHYKNSLLVPV